MLYFHTYFKEPPINIKQLKMVIYATYLTNFYALKLKFSTSIQQKKKLRIQYADHLLNKLNIHIDIINKEKLPSDGQYLLVSNHRSVIDPLIIELCIKKTELFGHWISKKELYNSFFFGLFVRNAGTILLDRKNSQMSSFFSDIKKTVKQGNSIYIFPEGTRNKTGSSLTKFKDGSRIIAVKNRLSMLPIYIKSPAEEVLMSALNDENKKHLIEVEIGDVIDYKDKSMPLEQAYKNQFSLP